MIADVDIAKSGEFAVKCTIEGFILAYLKIVDMNWRTSVAEEQYYDWIKYPDNIFVVGKCLRNGNGNR